jgi:hypothetical protein
LRSPGSKTLDSTLKRVIAKQLHESPEPPFCGAGLRKGLGTLLAMRGYSPLIITQKGKDFVQSFSTTNIGYEE